MDRIERTDMLREAQEMIAQAVELIREATRETYAEGRARAYIIGHLESWMNDERQIGSIPDLIEDLEEIDVTDDQTRFLNAHEEEMEDFFTKEMEGSDDEEE